MKKTININMAGFPFIIDEDAYELLRNYIDTLRDAFRKTDDCREILADIESRISELLSEKITDNNSAIVSLADVENVIARIGKPEEMLEFEETIEQADTRATTDDERISVEEEVREKVVPPPYVPPLKVSKKLFRDPNNCILGGVCAGLGWFFNIDTTWVRLATIAIAILAGAADIDSFYISLPAVVMLYVILWIILPEAKTPYEKMQMMGESASISNIGRTVTDTFRKNNLDDTSATGTYRPADTADDVPPCNNVNRDMNNANINAGNPSGTFSHALGVIVKVLMCIALIIIIPVLIALTLGIIGCTFALMLFGSEWGLNIWNQTGASWMPEPIVPICCGLSYCVLIGVPLALLVKKMLFKNTKTSRAFNIAILIVWVASFIGAPLTTAMLINDGYNYYDERKMEYNEYWHQKEEREFEETTANAADTTSVYATSTDSITIES